jgi:uncharacterized RDD family membrane protein YckC
MFCPQCGAPNETTSSFCMSCGTALSDSAPQPSRTPVVSNASATPAPPIPVGGSPRASQPAAIGEATAASYASLGDRALAQLVDGLVAFGVYFFFGTTLAPRLGGATASGFDLNGGPALVVISLTVVTMLVYFILAEAVAGATLGKVVAGIRVQPGGGGSIGVRAAVIRNVLRLVDGIVLYVVGVVTILVTARKQRLGDLAARTVVVGRERAAPVKLVALAAAIVVAIGGIVGGFRVRSATSLSFTTIDVPDATGTTALGINQTGQIVGEFADSSGNIHGYLRGSTGGFTTLDAPGATKTQAWGINDAGWIVGFFVDAGGKEHGFFRAPTGVFTTLDVPGAIQIGVYGINAAAQIVGVFNDGKDLHGFFRTAAGALTTIDPPSGSNTSAEGINGAGQIVGSFTAGGKVHGFLRGADGAFTIIDAPGAVTTTAQSINGAGRVVGFFFHDAGGQAHGYLRTPAGAFSMLDLPGAAATNPEGINDAGQITGIFVDATGKRHGFVTAR